MLLDPALRAAAKRRASERGLSVSAYIRELIRTDAASRATGGDITPLIGMLGTGTEPTDIARHKHQMVQQASVYRFGPGDPTSTAGNGSPCG